MWQIMKTVCRWSFPGGNSSGETNVVEKCEAQLVDSLSKGLLVGDCWDVKAYKQTRYKLKRLTWYCQSSRLVIQPLNSHKHLILKMGSK